MIYIKFDRKLIPDALLKAADVALAELEKLKTHDERKAFIDKKSQIWSNMKPYLERMSDDKCWYSEAKEPQSGFDVDHFRPKKRAKRSDGSTDNGYPWLAFSPENFRLSAIKSNRPNKNTETGVTEGKADWFPLLDGSPKATWINQCCKGEKIILLDPCDEDDVTLLSFEQNGRVEPSELCAGTDIKRVKETRLRYGLNLPRIVEARIDVRDDIIEIVNDFKLIMSNPVMYGADGVEEAAKSFRSKLRRKAAKNARFSRMARDEIRRQGYSKVLESTI